MPLRVAGSVSPWFFLLGLFLLPEVRRVAGEIKPAVGFVIIALAVAWPTVWLSPTSQNRHFMPLYPVLALAMAIAAAAVPGAQDDPRAARWWRAFLGVLSLVMIAAAIALSLLAAPAVVEMLAKAMPNVVWANQLHLSVRMAGLFLAASVILAAIAQWASWGIDAARMRTGVLAVALFLGLVMIGPLLSLDLARAIDIRPAVARLRQTIGDQTLVSYGPTNHLFAYYYRTYIPILNWPKNASDANAQVDYFSYVGGEEGMAEPKLPFAWEKIGEYCCVREPHKRPLVLVVVGRRKAGSATQGHGQ